MTIEKEINKLRERRESRTVLAFIVGALTGGIFGSDLLTVLLAGVIAAIIIWTGYSDEITKQEKERTLDGR